MLTSVLFGAFLLWFVFPFPHSAKFEAITAPENKQIIYVPVDSVVEKVFITRGETVKKGQPIIQLYSKKLVNEIKELQIDRDTIETQIQIIALKTSDPSFLPRKQEELDSNKSNLKRAMEINEQLNIHSDLNGKVYTWNENLKPGLYLPKNAIIGKIADPHHVVVWAYVPEKEISFVHLGKKVEFRLKSNSKSFNGEVIGISPTNERILQFPPLASIYKGPIAVSNDRLTSPEGLMKMQQSYYPVLIKIDVGDEQIPFEQLGKVTLVGPWRSKMVSMLRSLAGVFWRQSGF